MDVGFVAGNLGLDLPAVQAVTTNPTAELVATLLQAVQKKLHEYDELYSNKLQVDIEYEAAVRSAETRSQTSKTTVDKALKDTEEARQKLKEEGKSLSTNLQCDGGIAHIQQRTSDKPSRMSYAPSRRRKQSTTAKSSPSTTRSRLFKLRTGRTSASSNHTTRETNL